MKLKSILFSLIVMFIVLFVDVVNAGTTVPSSFIVNGSDLYKIDLTKILPHNGMVDYDFHYKQNSDEQVIYCVQSHEGAAIYGNNLYTLKKEMDAKFAYVIANGYPYKSITGDKDTDYFITAFAVFYLIDPNDTIFQQFDLEKGTYRGTDSTAVKEINKLVVGANNYSYVEPTIDVKLSSNGFVLSSDKKYYVSSNIGVDTTGIVGDYSVSLTSSPSGTIVTDINGNEKSTFAISEEFIVMVPVSNIEGLSSEVKFDISATGSINKVYEYENSSYQNSAAMYPDLIDLNANARLELSLTTKVKISKVDATTGNELPGATLVVKDSAGNVVDSWVSTTEVHIIENLVPGTYTLTETIAPEGYELSTETITFEIKADGSVTEVVMVNKPKDKTPIYISKQDFTTKEELPGAHLELRNESGELVEAWVSSDTPHMIEQLDPGKYYLTETLAPEGYELSNETVEFIVKEDGTVDGIIVMYNKAETVEVPGTSSFKTITSSLIGIIVIGLGSMIIYKNYKKNEEY